MGIEFPKEYYEQNGLTPPTEEERPETVRLLKDGNRGRDGNRQSNGRGGSRGGDRQNYSRVGNLGGNRQSYSRGGNPGGSRQNFNRGGNPGVSLPHATAPYNFIGLPEEILPSPLDSFEAMRAALADGRQGEIQKAYRGYLEKEDTYDGYIELEMQTLTPLFIGGNGTQPFAPFDPEKPIIPGSSIRGMTKNLLKIVTLGGMRDGEDFHNRHLYYRCIMAQSNASDWQKDLHAMYKGRMTVDGVKTKTKPGFLIKTRTGYAISPLHPDKYPERVLIREYENQSGIEIDRNMRDVRVEWDLRGNAAFAYAISGCRSDKDEGELFETKQAYLDRLAEIAETEKTDPDAAAEMRRQIGKQFVRKYNLADADLRPKARIKIDKDVMKEYEDDKNRRGVNLLRERKNPPGRKGDTGGAIRWGKVKRYVKNAPDDIVMIAPCFYLPDDNGYAAAFGHGQCFRIPYCHSIGDLVPERLTEDTIDFADAIFGAMRKDKGGGKKALWSSRVFFEDAHPLGEIHLAEIHRAHPLSSPNPTSFQLYLEQKSGDPMKNWDSDGARLRGYKLYWHIPERGSDGKPAWHAADEEIAAIDMEWNRKERILQLKAPGKCLTAEIAPIKTGARFSARIRFSRLRKEELGALLMVFDMEGNKNLAYKLGKGKSIGLGSFRITSSSLFINKKDGFGELFTADGCWNDPCVKEDAADYLGAFRQYVKNQKDGAYEKAWQHTMGEAVRMLDWSANTALPGWERETKEMRPTFVQNNRGQWTTKFNKDFQNRKLLLSAEDVVKRSKSTKP